MTTPPLPGAPVAPRGPMFDQPSKTIAGWALGLAIVGCCIGNVVSAILAFITLSRSRQTGRDHGRALAVAALAINAASIASLTLLALVAWSFNLLEIGSGYVSGEPENADPRIVDHPDLAAGDCFLDASIRHPKKLSPIRKVACGQAHDAEVIGQVTLKGKAYPGAEAVTDRADTACTPLFARYIGTAVDSSAIELWWYHPQETTWSTDKVVTCFVVDPQGRVKGSLKSTRR